MRGSGAILPLILSLISRCWAQNQCFYPNGVQSKTDFPCDPTAADSPCCGGGAGTFCLTNKLCRGPDGNIVRGSCTDKDWSSSDCPLFCLSTACSWTLTLHLRDMKTNHALGASTGGTDLISCSNVTGSGTSYCCDHQAFCCDQGVARFDVLPADPQVLARWDTKASQFVAVSQTTSSSRTSSTISTTTSSTNPATASVSSPPSSPTPSDTADPAPALSTGAKAGIGVGAAVLAIALAAVAYLLFKLRKKKAQLVDLQQEQHQLHYNRDGTPMVYGSGQPEGKVDDTTRYQHPYGRVEMATGLPSQEMDGQGARFELGSEPSTVGRGW